LISPKRVAHFVSARGPVEWNGRGSGNRPVGDGYYVVRYRIRFGGGAETRRVALRRRHGRFSVLAPYERPEGCGLLASYKLARPVFGGADRRALAISYRVNQAAQVSLSVRLGSRVVRRYRRRDARPGTTYRLRFAGGRASGHYRFRLSVAPLSGRKRLVTALIAHRL
jgi:hypothetical protein